MTNFLRSYEREMVKYTDAPDIFHTASATTLLGAALTRHRYRCLLSGGVPARWTNLWTFLVGDSAESRKSTAVNMAVEVLARAMPELRAPDDGSPEGFAKDFVTKENRRKGDAAGIFMQDELGMFLMNMQKDYMKPLKGMLMAFYDVPPVYKKKLSKEEFSVPRPRFSMLGGVALELLPNLTSAEDWLGGFMNRTLIIYGQRTRTLEEAGTPPETLYRTLANQLLATLKAWHKTRLKAKKLVTGTERKAFLLNYEPDARAEVKQLRGNLARSYDPNVKLLRGRADVHLMKLAACEQIAMDPEATVITKQAVRNAFGLFRHWWEHAPMVMETAFARSNADLEGDRLPRRILRLLRERPEGYRETDLMQATVLNWEVFNKALLSLQMAHCVTREDDGTGSGSIIKFKPQLGVVDAEGGVVPASAVVPAGGVSSEAPSPTPRKVRKHPLSLA